MGAPSVEATDAPEAVDVPVTPVDPVAAMTAQVVEVVTTEAAAALDGTIDVTTDAMTPAPADPSGEARSAMMTTTAAGLAWCRARDASPNRRSHPMSPARRSIAACGSSCAP